MNYSKPDEFTVPDFPYDPEALKIKEIKVDKFNGYRALDNDDYILWQQALLDAES